MKRKYIILSAVILLLIPLVIFSYKAKAKEDKPEENKDKTVKLLDNEEIKELELEKYVLGVVACEMPASFEIEAIKAQSIATRTYALYKMDGSRDYDLVSTISDQCYIEEDAMREKWNEDFDKYYDKLKSAVESTKGIYMTYNDKVIKAFYFSTSNGYTEDVVSVFGENLDYLTSVESPYEDDTTYYKDTKTITVGEFLEKLGLTETKINKIEVINRSSTGRVNSIEINGKSFKGTDVRKLLGLRSTDFSISYDSAKVIINTKGYGHGVGMSQYGANGMAKNGSDYIEILKHYYQNIELKSV